MEQGIVLSVSDFVAALNQTLEYAYPSVTIVGELANFRVSKNKWVYFDLKDDFASVKFFGTVYQLPGPLEDGLMVRVRGVPRLHNQFGFSINVQSMQPVGEGSLKKAAALLEAALRAEGLFDESRKRSFPYPPQCIGLVTSAESAAYHDFIKIVSARWSGLDIQLIDVQVQGEAAVGQVVRAIEHYNSHAEPVDVLVIIRGGGSADDLAAFSTEQVTRAVAASRIPTLVAIGHEVDVSLAELAADQRASTPSNAAEMLTPDKQDVMTQLASTRLTLASVLKGRVRDDKRQLTAKADVLQRVTSGIVRDARSALQGTTQLLTALSPQAALKRGYSIVMTQTGAVVRSGAQLKTGDALTVRVADATIKTIVDEVTM